MLLGGPQPHIRCLGWFAHRNRLLPSAEIKELVAKTSWEAAGVGRQLIPGHGVTKILVTGVRTRDSNTGPEGLLIKGTRQGRPG